MSKKVIMKRVLPDELKVKDIDMLKLFIRVLIK